MMLRAKMGGGSGRQILEDSDVNHNKSVSKEGS